MNTEIAPLVIRNRQVAAMLGWTADTFRRHYPRLREHGFPAYDEVVGGFHTDDVKAWLAARRNGAAPTPRKKEVNYDAL